MLFFVQCLDNHKSLLNLCSSSTLSLKNSCVNVQLPTLELPNCVNGHVMLKLSFRLERRPLCLMCLSIINLLALIHALILPPMIHRTFPIAASRTRALSTRTINLLCGTVPMHSSYVFLHSQDPPATFPYKFSTALQRELQQQTSKLRTIVNFAWAGVPSVSNGIKTAATIFSVSGGRLEIPEVSTENINKVEASLKTHIQRDSVTEETSHTFLCLHSRCPRLSLWPAGRLSGPTPQGDVDRRKMDHFLKVREVRHVGGHK